MNKENIVAISRAKMECTCMKCLNETDNIHSIEIPVMGYGSKFDGEGTKILLCDSCYQESNPEIWSMEVATFNEYCEAFVHENEMTAFIDALPLQSQELVWNEFAYGWHTDFPMKPQDWIDYKLNQLPHDKCRRYGLCSVEEHEAYKERYPKCEYVYNRVWNDESKDSACALQNYTYGEFGGGTCTGCPNECYQCVYFKERVTPIKTIKSDDSTIYGLYVRSKVIPNARDNKPEEIMY